MIPMTAIIQTDSIFYIPKNSGDSTILELLKGKSFPNKSGIQVYLWDLVNKKSQVEKNLS